MHGNVKDSDVSSWSEHVSKSLSDIARAEGKRLFCQTLFDFGY